MAKLSWKTEQRFVKDLMIAEINPRKISKEQKEALTKSLEKFNLADIPVLNTDNIIISGNQRLQILYELGKGDEKIDVRVPNRKLTDQELKEYMLIANTHAGVFDVELLEAHFEDVNIDFDIQLIDDKGKITVKGHERLKEGLTDDDEVPEPPKIAKSKPGQIWILGNHRLMCGDSTMIDDVERLMQNDKALFVLTDPPYNQETNGGFKGEIGESLKKQSSDIEHLCNFEPKDTLNILPLVFAKGKMNTTLFCNKDLVPDYLNWAKEQNYSFNILVWKKPSAIPLGGSYQPDIEYCLVFRKSAKFNTRLKDVSYSKVLEHKRETGLHPTMKPVAMLENQIKIVSDEKDICLDLFGGSGSTLIACEKTKRICRMVELDPKYCDVIIKRWQDFTGQKAILESTGQQFDSFN